MLSMATGTTRSIPDRTEPLIPLQALRVTASISLFTLLHVPATIRASPFLQRAVPTPSFGLLMSCDTGGEQLMDVKRRNLILTCGLMAVVAVMAGVSLAIGHFAKVRDDQSVGVFDVVVD